MIYKMNLKLFINQHKKLLIYITITFVVIIIIIIIILSTNHKKCSVNCDKCTDGTCITCKNTLLDEKTDCTTCKNKLYALPECTKCINPVYNQADDCKTCVNPFKDETDNCKTCKNKLLDEKTDCTTCKNKLYALPECTKCINPDDCKSCANPLYKYPECTSCANSFYKYPDCTSCTKSLLIYPTCDKCFPIKTLPTKNFNIYYNGHDKQDCTINDTNIYINDIPTFLISDDKLIALFDISVTPNPITKDMVFIFDDYDSICYNFNSTTQDISIKLTPIL